MVGVMPIILGIIWGDLLWEILYKLTKIESFSSRLILSNIFVASWIFVPCRSSDSQIARPWRKTGLRIWQSVVNRSEFHAQSMTGYKLGLACLHPEPVKSYTETDE